MVFCVFRFLVLFRAVSQLQICLLGVFPDYSKQCSQQVSDSGRDTQEVLVIEGEADPGVVPRGYRRGRGKRGVTETTPDEEEDSDYEDYAGLEEDDPMKVSCL